MRSEGKRPQRGDAILIVEDDPLLRSFLARGLAQWFQQVTVTGDLREAKSLLASSVKFTVVVSDNDLPDGKGADLYAWMRDRKFETPFLLMSGGILSTRSDTGFRFLAKPFALAELLDQLADLIQSGWNIRH